MNTNLSSHGEAPQAPVQPDPTAAQRAALAGQLRQLRTQLRSLDRRADEDALRRLEEHLQADRLRVLLLGEMGRGKTTFLNALLGQKVLVASAMPSTVINEVRWGEKPRAFFHPGPGAVTAVELPLEGIKRVAPAGPNDAYPRVELIWPLELCRGGVELIEYPSLAGQDLAAYVADADLAVLVLSCEALLSTAERRLIEEVLLPAGAELFFVCNRLDGVPVEERPALEQDGRARLARYTAGRDDRIFFVSALQAVGDGGPVDAARLAASGVAAAAEGLAALLAAQRGRLPVQRARARGAAIARQACGTVDEQAAAQQAGLATLAQTQAEAEAGLTMLVDKRAMIASQVTRFCGISQDLVQTSAENFLSGLAFKVKDWVAAYQPKTVPASRARSEQESQALAAELAAHVAAQIEREVSAWNSGPLGTLLAERTARLREDLANDTLDFTRQLARVRELVAAPGGEVEIKIPPAAASLPASIVSPAFTASGGASGATIKLGDLARILAAMLVGGLGLHLIGAPIFVTLPVVTGGGLLLAGRAWRGAGLPRGAQPPLQQQVIDFYATALQKASKEESHRLAQQATAALLSLRDAVDQELGRTIAETRGYQFAAAARAAQERAAAEQALNRLSEQRRELTTFAAAFESSAAPA